MKKYSDHSAEEKLSLDSNALIRAATLEAIDRGVAPPTPLPDAMKSCGVVGFNIPADAHRVFEICAKANSYGQPSRTGIAFNTEAEALRALQGALSIVSEGYGDKERLILRNPGDGFEIRTSYIINTPQKGYWTKLTELLEDTEAFDKVLEECRADLELLRQKDYDRRILQEQRAQYLQLANGDENVAKAFWEKTKHVPWPEAVS